MADKVYMEENEVYQIDCSTAVWSTNQVYAQYHASGVFLSDVDFVASTEDYIYLIEYKNAAVPNAIYPNKYQPQDAQNVDKIARKFYDSLHFLAISGKDKPTKYIFIVEYPSAGVTDRKMLRNKIATKLPFKLQENKSKKIIKSFDVVSISEWNLHAEYSRFPLTMVQQ